MTTGLPLEKGASLRTRNALSDRDRRRLPADAYPGEVVQYRGREARHHEVAAVLDVTRQDGMQKSGWRHIVLWTDPSRTVPLAVVETESADGVRAVYRVTDGSGNALARVTRTQGSVRRLRRTSWLVETPHGGTLRAVKGGVFGWTMFWLFSPLWALLCAAAIFGGDVWRMPVSTVWRREDGTAVLEFSTAEPSSRGFAVRSDWADGRLAFVLAALQHTHLPWIDRH